MNGNIDEVRFNILNVIHSLAWSYNLSIEDIIHHKQYLESLQPDAFYRSYDDYARSLQARGHTSAYSNESVSSECLYESSEFDDSDLPEKIFVSSRREFTHALNKGIKICPKYSSCTNPTCTYFHIAPEYLCPHNPKNNYCSHDGCDLIVIKPCNRGRQCSDANCSFRH